MNKAASISAISTAYAYQILNEIVEILLLNGVIIRFRRMANSERRKRLKN